MFKHVWLNNKDKFCLYNFIRIFQVPWQVFLFYIGIGRWNYRNCPQRFWSFHRPSSVVVCMCKDCFFLTTRTLSRRLTLHLYDSSSMALHLKSHSIPKSEFQKILVEYTTIIAHEINKLQLQVWEAIHIKTKRNRINRINFENNDNVLKYLSSFLFFNILFLLIIFYLS